MTFTLKNSAAALLAALLGTGAWAADNPPNLKSDTDQASYAIGYEVGSDMKRVHVDLNSVAVARGIADARTGKPLMSEAAMKSILTELKRRVVAQDRQPAIDEPGNSGNAATPVKPRDQLQARHMSAQGDNAAKKFFAENARNAGVVALPSGLQYEVLTGGHGKQPKTGDQVRLVYHGALVNGTEFGSSGTDARGTPRTFSVDALVPGLREAVSRMKEGDEWRVFVPPELGFDAHTPLFRKITVFDIRLVSVVSR